MTYERFERLVLSVGAVAVIGAMLTSLGSDSPVEELAGQVLMLVVLIGAVHWGRNGGFTAAVGASLAYFLMRIPTVVSHGGMNMDIAALVAVRLGAYGLIGIVGGELCTRMKYILARLEDDSSIDECTRVYNENGIARVLASAHAQHLRYGSPYSVALISLVPEVTEGLRPSRQRTLLRRVADHMRSNVRLVDEVGRLGDGRLVLLLPHTPLDGACAAAERIRTGVRDLLGARDGSVSAEVLGAPEDVERLAGLLSRISPGAMGPSQDEESSVA